MSFQLKEKEETAEEGGVWLTISDEQIDFYAKTWKVSNPKATVTFIHGIGEHILRYEHVFKAFNEKGIAVFAFDQRGFGRTVHKNSVRIQGGRQNAMVLGDSQGWDVALKDIFRACSKEGFTIRQPGVPHFLMGHSMGGLLCIGAAMEYGKQLDITGLIVSAPALRPGFPVPFLKRTIGTFVSKFLGSMNIPTDLDTDKISKDTKVVEAYKKDPYVHGMGSLRTLASLLDKGEEFMKDSSKYPKDLPLLITFGSDDRLTDYKSGKLFYEKLNCDDKTFESYEGFWHELHNEPEKEKPIAKYIEWILKHAEK